MVPTIEQKIQLLQMEHKEYLFWAEAYSRKEGGADLAEDSLMRAAKIREDLELLYMQKSQEREQSFRQLVKGE